MACLVIGLCNDPHTNLVVDTFGRPASLVEPTNTCPQHGVSIIRDPCPECEADPMTWCPDCGKKHPLPDCGAGL